MENIFAKRRARLLAMKAMRENYVPGEKLVTCPHCGGESQRKDVAAALSVCPLCGYHFPMGAYYRLSSVLDPGSFRELHEKLTASDPLRFPGYGAKLDGARRKTGMNEAVVTATAGIDEAHPALLGDLNISQHDPCPPVLKCQNTSSQTGTASYHSSRPRFCKGRRPHARSGPSCPAPGRRET